VIRKGTLSKPTEYGRLIWLDEVEGGIISCYAVLVGNPADNLQMPASIAHHQRLFNGPPRLLTADRGCWSPENEATAKAAGLHGFCTNI
jgi:hypothetical protein